MNRSLFLFALIPVSLLAGDWPQYRGPSGDGRSTETLAKPWAGNQLKTLWKAPTDGGFSSLAVGGGKAFTLALKEVEGVRQEALVALEAATGKELWSAPLNFAKYDGGGDSGASDNGGGDGPRSTPAIAGDRVFAFSSLLSLRCFNAADGQPVWTRDLLKEHSGRNIQWQNATSPLLEGGLLYVAGGGPGESLLAINPEDGAVVWKAFDEKMTHATPVAATILGQRQVIFFLQSGLLSVEPKTGRELWRYPFSYKISTAASPVVDGDIVYCSAGYGVGAGAVKITKGGDAWTATELFRQRGDKPLANHWSTPVAKDGFLYGMFQFKQYGNGPVKAVEMATGQVKWEKEGFGPGHIIRLGDQLVALSDHGDLVLIAADPAEYKEMARAHVVDGKCWSVPAFAGGRFYVRSTKEAACVEIP